MLKDLTRDDWLSILNIPAERIPIALVLRGTRNLKLHYESYQRHFTNILEVGTPNGVLEDVFIGDLGDHPVAYASVYGAPMASELVHVFGVLGTPLVIQTGCCGALADEMMPGDLFVATEAYCGEGASQYYNPGDKTVQASMDLRSWRHDRGTGCPEFVAGRVYTTSALFAEGMDDIEAWHQEGFAAVDMETAATFAVARYFGMDRASILYAFDNPRRKEHILLDDVESEKRRAVGNRRVIELALKLVKEYAARRYD